MSPNPFLSPSPIEHEVDGVLYKFWPISVGQSFKLRGLAKPVAKAVAALLSSSQNDIGKESSEVRSADGTQIRTTIQPITHELAKLRFEQRQVSLESLLEGLMNDGSAAVLAGMVMDSMREAYATKIPAQKFLDEVPAPAFMEMLGGVAKANAKLFDPLKQKAAEVTAALKSEMRAVPQPSEPPEDSPSPNEPTTASG